MTDMPEFIIAPAAVSDAEAVARIENECFSQPLTYEQIVTQINDESYILLCAKDGAGELIGYAGMYFVLDEGYITNVAVSPLTRRMHAGDALMEGLEGFSVEKELSFITLEVRESNAPAIALYAKHGFAAAGLRRDYYMAPKENAVIMTKYLK